MRPFPTLYQIDTRDWLYRCSVEAGEPVTLDRIPDAQLDRFKALGFDYLWPLGIWQTGEAGAKVSRSRADWQESFRKALPDLTPADITGSPYAITAYHVHAQFGGPEALTVLRRRLRERGVQLMLDFVPNHVALDHEWATSRPQFLIAGTEELIKAQPSNYIRLGSLGSEGTIFAHGRDPNFSGWPDTLQLDYSNPGLQEAMIETLESIATQCDGVRCDMAMLILPEIFQRTWGRAAAPFWPPAIARVQRSHPQFVFMAEVYWGLEWQLQQQGFAFTYDKTLYDRVLARSANAVRGHLQAEWPYQKRSVRFLENHDEARAAAQFPGGCGRAAAVVSFYLPGLRFFHDGQLQGAQIKPSVHLRRRAIEEVDRHIAIFYERLLAALKDEIFQRAWRLLDTVPAWENNPTASDILCFSWSVDERLAALIAVNFSDHQSQCYVHPLLKKTGGSVTFRDLLSEDTYVRDGAELSEHGLYLDLAPWEGRVFRADFK
jgi:hypothetical protein